MDIGTFSYYARKIHRLLMLFIVVLGLVQMVTGMSMKYPGMIPFMDSTAARLLHNQTATYFSFVFGLQMITGLVMYLAPTLIKTFRKPFKATDSQK